MALLRGRGLEYVVEGPADGLPLVLHHGTPGAAILYRPGVEAAAAVGLRTVVYARGGYGDSSRHRGRRVADAAADVAALLDGLGDERFVTAGWSGGGPHALACAALLGPRCAAVATIGGVAPYDAPGLDWLAGMGPENVEEFGAARRGEADLTPLLEVAASALADLPEDALVEAFGGLIGRADTAALTDDAALGAYMHASLRRAVETGTAGWVDDDLAFVAPWGFDLDAIAAPVTVWRGDDDFMVPPAHGAWLAERLPGAEDRLVAGEGHISLFANAFADIVARLAHQAGL